MAGLDLATQRAAKRRHLQRREAPILARRRGDAEVPALLRVSAPPRESLGARPLGGRLEGRPWWRFGWTYAQPLPIFRPYLRL